MSIRNGNLRPRFWTLFLYALVSTSFIFSLSSCSKDNENVLKGKYAQGYLVVNEGVFGQNNASVTHISENDALTQQIFQTVTGESLGDNLQLIFVLGDKAYLMVSNSNKIEVVNRGTFERITTIRNNDSTSLSRFANPRYMTNIGNNKAYISTWGNFDNDDKVDGKILIVDTKTDQIITTIEAGLGAEDIVYDNKTNKVFVANSFETTVSVYNVSNNTLETTLDFAPNNPNQIVIEQEWKPLAHS